MNQAVNIVIAGPVGCGKSVIAQRIQRMLEDFGATVQVTHPDIVQHTKLENWEREMIAGNHWVITETGTNGGRQVVFCDTNLSDEQLVELEKLFRDGISPDDQIVVYKAPQVEPITHEQLFDYYGVATVDEVIQAQSKHIATLQKQLAAERPKIYPTRIREG